MNLSLVVLVIYQVEVTSAKNDFICSFQYVTYNFVQRYSCVIDFVRNFDDAVETTIGGTHQSGRSDDDVVYLRIINCNISRIVTEFFTQFRNLQILHIVNGGLREIQVNAFNGANNIQTVEFSSNDLRVINEHSFNGLPSLNWLQLDGNNVVHVNENAFTSLEQLSVLLLDFNPITSLPPTVFYPLTGLHIISLSHLLLTTIDGRLFAKNINLDTISLENNEISAIESTFLDNVNFRNLDMTGNKCINQNFRLVAMLREEVFIKLNVCFSNFLQTTNLMS